MFKHTQIVEQMYQMLNHYDVKIADFDLVQLDELRAIQAKYAEELETCQAFRDERLPEMRAQLEANVKKLDDQLNALAREVETGGYVDVAQVSQPAAVLADLTALSTKLEALQGQDQGHRKELKLFAAAAHTLTAGAEPAVTKVVETTPKGSSLYERGSAKSCDNATEVFERMRTLWTMVERWHAGPHKGAILRVEAHFRT